MENKNSIWISILVILIILLGLSFISSRNYKPSKNLIIEDTYELKDIIINSNASNINIKESNDQIIKVKIYGDDKKTSIKDYDKLTIKSNIKECKFFCLKNEIASIEISLPKNYDNKLIIKNDYGNVNVGNFENSDFDIEVDAGKVTIDEVKNIKLDVDAGDIKIGKINNKLNIEADAGNVIINEINLNENSTIDIDAGNLEIGKTNEIYIDPKIDLGAIDINNNYRKSDIELKINIDAGNISIKN